MLGLHDAPSREIPSVRHCADRLCRCRFLGACVVDSSDRQTRPDGTVAHVNRRRPPGSDRGGGGTGPAGCCPRRNGPGCPSPTTTGGAGPFANDPSFKDFFDQFFGPRGPEAPGEFRTPGLGSGVIIDKRGYVITNFHVVKGADAVIIRLSSKEEFRGRVVGSDVKTDLAVVRFDPERTELRVAQLGNSDTLAGG